MHRIPLNKWKSHFLHIGASCQLVRGYLGILAWQKQSAAVGLAGFTPHEAALGVLCCEQFQLMLNPLAGVKKEDMFMMVSALFSYSTMYNVDTVETSKEFNTTVCTLI